MLIEKTIIDLNGKKLLLRNATLEDLMQLKTMFKEIVDYLNGQDICIWDDIYPCEFLIKDIEQERFYILEDENTIVGGFALCRSQEGQSVDWKMPDETAMFVERLGVDVRYLKKGIGSRLLQSAEIIAKEKGAESVRLLVVDTNIPAINLYIKCGYQQADGTYAKYMDQDWVLREYGFEKGIR